MTKDELLFLIDSLGIVTEYYCDNGAQSGNFKVKVTNPYIPTRNWDRLQQELRPRSIH